MNSRLEAAPTESLSNGNLDFPDKQEKDFLCAADNNFGIRALDRQAQPCVRFDSKDVIEWSPEPCSCGRTSNLIKGGVVGRADDITKVKGVLLAPSAIEEVVRSIEGLGDEYEVIVEKAGAADQIKLRVEVLAEAEDQCTLIESELVDQLRLKTNLRYDIEICGCETLPRYEVKARRFKDLRKKES